VLIVLGLAAVASAQSVAPPAQTQSATAAAAKAPRAVVRGRVVAGDTGQPLRRAQVRLMSTEMNGNASRQNLATATDADGKFEFTDLPAGRYLVTANKAGYVSRAQGQGRPGDQLKPIAVSDGQVVERIDFSLLRGGVIAGRVVDEYGEPLSNIQVGAMRREGMSSSQLFPTRTTASDDLGEFRLFGLAPGDYFVQGTWRDFSVIGGPAEEHSGYAVTLYPGVADSKDAQPIPIGAGTIVTDVVFAMRPVTTARVSGIVTDSRGRRGGGSITVSQQAGANNYVFTGTGIRPDGTFSISGLPSGDYTLRAETAPLGSDGELAVVNVTVNGDDIENVAIVTAPPPKAAGRIVADPELLPTLAGAMMFLNGFPAAPNTGVASFAQGRVADDLTFTLTSNPGRMKIMLNGLPPGFSVRAVRLNGTDVTDSGLEFKGSETIAGVEVEVTNRVTTVAGAVRTTRGEAAKEYTVVVFSQDRERFELRMATPDQEGRFKITGVRPGDYYAIAFERMDTSRVGGPDFIDRWRQQAVSFSIGEGESKTFDLKLTTGMP
jgi:hypothetical protein